MSVDGRNFGSVGNSDFARSKENFESQRKTNKKLPIKIALAIKPFFEKLKSDLKNHSSHRKILNSSKRMVESTVQNARWATQVVSTSGNQVVKSSSRVLRLLLISVFYLFLFLFFAPNIFIYTAKLFKIISDSFLALNSLKSFAILTPFIDGINSGFLPQLSFYFVILLIGTFLWKLPTLDKDHNEIFYKEFKWFLILAIIIILISAISNSNFYKKNTLAEQKQIAKDTILGKIKSQMEDLSCLVTPGCMAKRAQEKIADTSQNTYYLKFEPIFTTGKDENGNEYTDFPIGNLNGEFPLDYKVKSDSNLMVEKIDCYIFDANPKNNQNVKVENLKPFYSKEIMLNQNSYGESLLSGISCVDIGKAILNLKRENPENNISIFTIVPKLTVSLQTKFSQVVPSINYQKLIEFSSLRITDGFQIYSKYKNENQFRIESDDKAFKGNNNNALEVSERGLSSKFPLIIGDKVEKPILFEFKVKVNTGNQNFGKFTEGKLFNLELPNSLKYVEGFEPNLKVHKVSQNLKEIVIPIRVMENEGYKISNELSKVVDNLNFDVEGRFVLEDRFNIRIIK